MGKLIEPRTLKGFRDSLPYGPQGEKRRRQIIAKLGGLFELGGFDPIDTPALELCEILLGNAGGETEKQIYRFQDNGGRDVALRFDLTVPFSRFVVQHAQVLHFPFKRYHIAKVWRGENAQRGRYREFFQCDFDIVGDDSVLADLCVLQTAHNALSQLQQDYPALGPLCIHVNHRGLLGAFWTLCKVAEEQRSAALRCIDKLHKIGQQALCQELEALLGTAVTESLIAYLGLNEKHRTTGAARKPEASGADSQAHTWFLTELQRLEQLLLELASGELPLEAQKALGEMQQVAAFAQQIGINLEFDSSIARGLDYYTGMVFETFLQDLPSLGSVCSGGRYDKLTQLYSKKPLPGVGGSIGLDRLLAGLEELEQKLQHPNSGEADYEKHYLILSLDPEWKEAAAEKASGDQTALQANLSCLQLSQELQQMGVACDIVPLVKKTSTLFQRAEAKNCRYLLLLNTNFSWQLRNLQSRENQTVATAADVLAQLDRPLTEK